MQSIFDKDPKISEKASKKFKEVKPLKIDEILLKFKNNLIEFDPDKSSLKRI